MKKEYMTALDYSLKALDKDPLNEKILQSILFSYRALGEPGNVLDYATRYRMVDQDNLHLEYILGEMYAKTLRCEKAVPHLKSALQKDDTYQNAQKLLDDCQHTLAMKEESLARANS
jgi:tetratricopeptide (TPR) repeat protein